MTGQPQPDPRQLLAECVASLAESARRFAAAWSPEAEPVPESGTPPLPYGQARLDKRFTARELVEQRHAAEAERDHASDAWRQSEKRHKATAAELAATNEKAEHLAQLVQKLKRHGDMLGKQLVDAQARIDAARTIITALRVYPGMHASLDLITRALDGDMPRDPS